MKLMSGDIILSTSNHWFGGKILLPIMKIFQKDPVIFTHSSIVKDENTIIEALIKIQETPINVGFKKWTRYKIIRLIYLMMIDINYLKKQFYYLV